MIKIKVKPLRQLFFNEEQSFGIFACEINPDYMDKVKVNQYNNISMKGVMPKLNIGEEYEVILNEDPNSKYKGSYILESVKKERPTTVAQQKSFLKSILTETQVNNIYEVYSEDDDIVGLIERNEFDFSKVKGIADKTFNKLREKVMANVDMNEVLAFLTKYGIKYNMIQKLIKEYGNPDIVIAKIENNPYLLTEVKGIGFTKADAIAKAVGFDMKSPHRINSCLKYVIGAENQNGHSWVDYKQLLNSAVELLNIEKSLVEEVISGSEHIINLDGRYTLDKILQAEKDVAMSMTRIKTQSKKMFETDELDTMIDEYCEKNNVELEANQRQFFHDWNENNILMLIGGGGMGKSWLQKILLEFVKSKNLKVSLLAPTGKASKVMTNYTGVQASTIHRKVRVFDNDEVALGEITEDFVIVDESSMCDIFILQKFFKAISNENARILFVGDSYQLPSVGVGNFLYDVINSSHIKVSKLVKVFRQADGGILNVATDVREGKRFLNDTDDGRIVFGKDCVFWLTESQYIKDGVIANYKKVADKFEQDEIVILTPTNKGKLGTVELNKEIQKIANPPSPNKKEKVIGHKDFPTTFRVGDMVMNTVNTYGIEKTDGGVADIFNGDTGKIIDIDDEKKVFIVEIDGIMVKMKFNTILTNLVHAWVTTIHKSQGSQYKVVIMVVDKSMTYQLNANLLYTGLSRATQFELVLGQAQTINRAIKKFANMERRSFMQDFLDDFNNVEEAV